MMEALHVTGNWTPMCGRVRFFLFSRNTNWSLWRLKRKLQHACFIVTCVLGCGLWLFCDNLQGLTTPELHGMGLDFRRCHLHSCCSCLSCWSVMWESDVVYRYWKYRSNIQPPKSRNKHKLMKYSVEELNILQAPIQVQLLTTKLLWEHVLDGLKCSQTCLLFHLFWVPSIVFH